MNLLNKSSGIFFNHYLVFLFEIKILSLNFFEILYNDLNFLTKRSFISSMIPNRFISHKLEILPVENVNAGNFLPKNKRIMGINRFFQKTTINNANSKIDDKSKEVNTNDQDMASNSLEKIWDIHQLGIGEGKETDKNIKKDLVIKREHSIELDRFEDFSRIDFDESESEQEYKKVVDLQKKAKMRKKRPFGGKIENRISISEPL